MPPGPAYNWYCVAAGAFDILSRAAQIHAGRVESQAACILRAERARKQPRTCQKQDDLPAYVPTALPAAPTVKPVAAVQVEHSPPPEPLAPLPPRPDTHHATPIPEYPDVGVKPISERSPAWNSSSNAPTIMADPQQHTLPNTVSDDVNAAQPDPIVPLQPIADEPIAVVIGRPEERMVEQDVPISPTATKLERAAEPMPVRKLQSSKVPSSRIGRLFHYGGKSIYCLSCELMC